MIPLTPLEPDIERLVEDETREGGSTRLPSEQGRETTDRALGTAVPKTKEETTTIEQPRSGDEQESRG